MGIEKEKPLVEADNAHFLKGHASWLYCDKCSKTVAYLCYVTYSYFKFSFNCLCENKGSIENRYENIEIQNAKIGELKMNPANKRFCCQNDESALFSPVSKNLKSYSAEIICKECNTKYIKEEEWSANEINK